MEQELLQKAMQMKQQSEETERQLDFVNQQIVEMEAFSRTLGEFDGGEGEILAGLGKGVFAKAERKKDEKLFVEVGAGVLVRKTPDEAKKIIDGQVKKFMEARVQLNEQMQNFAMKFQEMLVEMEGLKEDGKKD